jgi:hypothetical protein
MWKYTLNFPPSTPMSQNKFPVLELVACCVGEMMCVGFMLGDWCRLPWAEVGRVGGALPRSGALMVGAGGSEVGDCWNVRK